jgi:hypothetical protein
LLSGDNSSEAPTMPRQRLRGGVAKSPAGVSPATMRYKD